MSHRRLRTGGLAAAAALISVFGTPAVAASGHLHQPPAITAPGAGAAAGPGPAVRQGSFPVSTRWLHTDRGERRPLPALVWYPAGAAGAARPVAAGRFPVILLSHGLHGRPEQLGALGRRWAAAGFVVAAPAYPYTRAGARPFRRGDVAEQPLDASRVLTALLGLDRRAGDPFHGHLAAERVGAVGFSAGGYTTAGLLSDHRDRRIGAAVIIAGGAPGSAPFLGRPVPVLFLHADTDPVVPYARARAAYDRLDWPKAFLTLHRAGHGEYLDPARPESAPAQATIVQFLRATLYGDRRAAARLGAEARAAGAARWESRMSRRCGRHR